jgi:PKD repeat protein
LSGDCDSTLVTFIDNSIDGDIYSWDFGDGQNSTESNPTHTYFNTGVYNVTLTVTDTLSGLDSTITNAVNVYMTSEATITEIACNSYTAPDGTIYNTSGTKTAIIPNSVSCDSVITINLTINEVDTSVTQDSYELTSNATGATYQWLDCNNGFSTMPGETNSVFVATSNGSYAVEVTQNNCVDTTACFDVTTVGIEAMENQQTITIYPNPSKGIFTIYSYFDNSVPIQIIDLLGKEVLSPTNIDNGVNTIDISHLNKGIYFIKIINLKETYVHRIVLN